MSLKSVLKQFFSWIQKEFGGLTSEAKKLVPEIIQITTNIKNFVDSPGCDFLTSVIPGTLDDNVQDLLKQYLPKLLDILNKVESFAEIADQNERSKAIVASFQVSEQDAKDMFFHSIAGKLVENTIGTTWGKSVILAEGVYQNPELLANETA